MKVEFCVIVEFCLAVIFGVEVEFCVEVEFRVIVEFCVEEQFYMKVKLIKNNAILCQEPRPIRDEKCLVPPWSSL